MNLKDNYLGNGSFSICRRCQNRRSGQLFAVKIISKLHNSKKEADLLRLCQGTIAIEILFDSIICNKYSDKLGLSWSYEKLALPFKHF